MHLQARERKQVGHHTSEEIRVATREGCRDFAVLSALCMRMLLIFAFGANGEENLAEVVEFEKVHSFSRRFQHALFETSR